MIKRWVKREWFMTKQDWTVLTRRSSNPERWSVNNRERFQPLSFFSSRKRMKIWKFLEFPWTWKLCRSGWFSMCFWATRKVNTKCSKSVLLRTTLKLFSMSLKSRTPARKLLKNRTRILIQLGSNKIIVKIHIPIVIMPLI